GGRNVARVQRDVAARRGADGAGAAGRIGVEEDIAAGGGQGHRAGAVGRYCRVEGFRAGGVQRDGSVGRRADRIRGGGDAAGVGDADVAAAILGDAGDGQGGD